MKPLPLLAECEYTAFISYAHADDELAFNWVSQFRDELHKGLKSMLRGTALPPLHLSGDNGPQAGLLGEELKKRVAASFAMVIVVHHNYAQSEWCLKELEYFHELFGLDGLRERLFVAALSEPAVQKVSGGPIWKQLMPAGEHQLWTRFFDPLEHGKPVAVYLDRKVFNPSFTQPFEGLRDAFAERIKRAPAVREAARAAFAVPAAAASAPTAATPQPLLAAPAEAPAAPPLPPPPLRLAVPLASGAPAPPPASGVRLYIESNVHERNLWRSLEQQIQHKWEQIARRLEPDRVPPLDLRARGLPVDAIRDHPRLDDADGVVLLWGRKTPDSLIAQIESVERKMAPGRDAAPGIVAYLMPPQQSADPMPAWGWEVLRFDAADEQRVDVVETERDDLERFLARVLARRRRRDATAP
jgi:hypothetical protein